MARPKKKEPLLEITAAEKKFYARRAQGWARELRPDTDPESFADYSLRAVLEKFQIQNEKLIASGVPMSVARQAVSDLTTTVGTLLQTLGPKKP